MKIGCDDVPRTEFFGAPRHCGILFGVNKIVACSVWAPVVLTCRLHFDLCSMQRVRDSLFFRGRRIVGKLRFHACGLRNCVGSAVSGTKDDFEALLLASRLDGYVNTVRE